MTTTNAELIAEAIEDALFCWAGEGLPDAQFIASRVTAALESATTPEASDDYEAGYNEGFHHGRSTPRVEASDDERDDPFAKAGGTRSLGRYLIATAEMPGEVGSVINWAGVNYMPVPADTPSEDDGDERNRQFIIRHMRGPAPADPVAFAERRDRWIAEQNALIDAAVADTPEGARVQPLREALIDEAIRILGQHLDVPEKAVAAYDIVSAGWRPRPTPPEDVERVADLIRDGIRGERDDTSICVPVGDLKVLLAALAAVPAGTPSEDGYPEPHPAFPEGFASSHMRAILVDAYDRGVTSRPTPPEDVAEGRIPDLIQALSNYDAVNDDAVEEAVLAALDEVGIALAAVPTDGETETTIVVQVLCRDGVWRDTNWPSLAEARAEMPGAQANFRAVRVMVTPIPESEEQR